MALKKRKLPKPSEIKSAPTSFSPEELNELKELRNSINELSLQFGQLSINKIKIEETELKLKDELSLLEKKETKIAKNLSDKYGDGSINLESGTFIPLK
jgi:hypothetical protein